VDVARDAEQALSKYFVPWKDIVGAELAAYEQALAEAANEAAMQEFLEANPRFLIQHLGGGRGRWVIPKKRLGSEHETDFLIGERETTGYVWYAVELERPQAKLFTGKGDPTAALTHAIRQMDDWRSWLSRNRDYASRPREQAGLGLIDIDPELEGLIIMGREQDVDQSTRDRHQRLGRTNRVRIHTFDWLAEQAKGRLATIKSNPLEEPSGRILEQPKPVGERAVTIAFNGSGSASMDVSATRSLDWNFVSATNASGADLDIVTDYVRASGIIPRPLSKNDWEDWCHHVAEDISEPLSLLLTERPPEALLISSLVSEGEGVWYSQADPSLLKSSRLDVLLFIPEGMEEDQAVRRASAARNLLTRIEIESSHFDKMSR
jgi:hypothetical protein